MPGSIDAVEVFRMHRQHPVHVAEVDRDAAERRVDAPFEGCPGAEGNDRHAAAGADAHHLLHVLGGLRIDDGVGRLGCDPGRGVSMLLADDARGDQPVAEGGCQLFDARRDLGGVRTSANDLVHGPCSR